MASSRYILFVVAVCFTYEGLASGQLGSKCNFTLVNEKTRVMKSIPIIKRDTTAFFIEYSVSFTGNFTGTDNGSAEINTRFQPKRWFNVHTNATMELQLMYDSYFDILRWLLIFNMKELEIAVTPSDCLQSLNNDELNNLTQDFLAHKFQMPDFKICSAHIGDHNGEGKLVFRCCEPSSSEKTDCTNIHEDNLLFKLHIFSIIVTVFVLSCITYFIFRTDLGLEKYQLYPERLKLKLTQDGGNSEHEIRSPSNVLSIPNKVFNRMTNLKKSIGREKSVVKPVESITFLINKKRCCSEGKAGISFVRTIAESLIHVKSSVKKLSKKICGCCSCKSCCCSSCGCISLENLFLLCILLMLYIPSVPLIVLYFRPEPDYKVLCREYRQRDLTCPFYYIGDNEIAIMTCIASILYVIGSGWLMFSVCKNKSCLPQLKCNKCGFKRVVFNFFVAVSLCFTWGLGIHFIIYSFVRSIVTSAITKNTFDDISPMILPLLFFVKDKIINVSKQYRDVVGTVLKYVEPKINLNDPENDKNAEKVSKSQRRNTIVAHKDNEDRTSIDDEESRIDITDAVNDINTVDAGDETDQSQKEDENLNLVYMLAGKPISGTDKFIVLLFSFGTCIVFILIFYLFIAYGTVYSYSNEVIGYIAFFLTFLNIIKEQFFDSVNSSTQQSSTKSDDKSCPLNLQDQVINFKEIWTVADITLKEHDESYDGSSEQKDWTTISFNIQKEADTHCICRTNSIPLHGTLESRHNISISIKKSKKGTNRVESTAL